MLLTVFFFNKKMYIITHSTAVTKFQEGLIYVHVGILFSNGPYDNHTSDSEIDSKPISKAP